MSNNMRLEFDRCNLSGNRIGYVSIANAASNGSLCAMRYVTLDELYAFANELFKEAAAIEAEQNLKAANPMHIFSPPFYQGPLS